MRHARADDLTAHEDLLASLRAIPGLRERTAGSFYRRGGGFLHFHVDGDRLFADLKVGDAWERLPATTASDRRRLVAAARRAAGGAVVD